MREQRRARHDTDADAGGNELGAGGFLEGDRTWRERHAERGAGFVHESPFRLSRASDDGVLGEVAWMTQRRRLRQIAGGRDEHGRDVSEPEDTVARVGDRAAVERGVEAIGEEPERRVGDAELEANLGMAREEIGEDGCEEIAHRGRNCDAQDSARRRAMVGDGALRVFQLEVDAATMGGKRLADLGRSKAAGRAFERANTEPFLECGDTARERRWRNAELRRRGSEGPAVDDAREDDEVGLIDHSCVIARMKCVFIRCRNESPRARCSVMNDFDGKVAVVMGASAGLGASIAAELTARGASVVRAARRQVDVVADATRRADVERVFATALARFGRVDIWINNVGRGQVKPVLELTDEDLDAMMLVNLKSALYGMQVAAPHLVARGTGAIVNVSTIAARLKVMFPVGAYAASKAAMSRLSDELRGELAAHPGVRIVAVYPGVIATDFGNNSEGGGHADSRAIPGAQTPAEVAKIVCDAALAGPLDVYTQPHRAEQVRDYANAACT